MVADDQKDKNTDERAEELPKTLQVEIVSAEKQIFSGQAKMVIVTGEEGDLGILPGHVQLLTSVKPGQVRLVAEDDSESFYYISGGFLEVQPAIVTVLADTILRAADVDRERALQAKEQAEKILTTSKRLDDYTAALIELSKAMAQLRVSETWRRVK